jgi:hypothetical protein
MSNFSSCRTKFNDITMRVALGSTLATIASTAGLVATAIISKDLVPLLGAIDAASAVTAAGTGIAYGFGSDGL